MFPSYNLRWHATISVWLHHKIYSVYNHRYRGVLTLDIDTVSSPQSLATFQDVHSASSKLSSSE